LKLFGSSGVRGLVNADLTAVLAEQIGVASATFSKAKEALVARDTRPSGLMIENALTSGLESAGTSVKQLGILPTPVLAFLTRNKKVDIGFMITASHNPPEYNGIKVFNSDGLAYDQKKQNAVEKIIEHKAFTRVDWKTVGHDSAVNEDELYIEAVEREVRLNKKWHVIVDPGCGATFRLAPTILQRLGCKVTALNAQPDGWFPARSSEPNAESLTLLAEAVRMLGVDAGLAYDGDGDRAAFIDKKGYFVDFDQVLAAYAANVISEKGKGTIVTSVETSMCIEKMVEPRGGKVVRTKVGDVYISEMMKRTHALFGGEPCGAWIHPQVHYCPDGILSSALLLQALEDEDKSLAEFAAEAPKYPVLRRSFRCRNELKEKAVKQAGEAFKSVFQSYKDISAVDGFRLVLEEGWLLVRASGTEPLLRVTVEGESLKAAEQIMEKGAESMKKLLGNDDS